MPLFASREPTKDDLAFGFVGCRVVVRGGDPEVRASIAATLGRCRVELDEDSPPGTMPIAAFEIGFTSWSGYSLRRQDGPLPLGGRGDGGVRPGFSTDGEMLADGLSAFDLRERLVYEVTLALARGVRGWPVFHAAGLAWGGIGIVLAGVSGAGKSTLATHLLALGGELLSDELVAISPGGGRMVGFPRPVVLKDGGRALGAEWLSSRLGATPQPEPDGAVRIDPARLAASHDPAVPQPCLLVFPRYTSDAPTSVQPLTRGAAIYRLLPGLMNAPAFADRGLGAVAGALAAIRPYCVEYGDGEAAMQAIIGLISRP